MPIKVERTLFKIGEGSYAVILPKAWVRYNQLRPGDRVEIVVNDSLTIRTQKESTSKGDQEKSL
jgi:antitoxin component of MazEF toxin-antitoxin module